MPCRISICTFGDSGDGKTAQGGEYALHLVETRGTVDKDGRPLTGKTRLYSLDGGGWQTVQPLVDAGVMEVVDLRPFAASPWDALNWASRGHIVMPDGKTWSPTPVMDGIAGLMYEGLSAVSNVALKKLRDSLADGTRVIKGRGQDMSFKEGTTSVGANNETHYGVVQGLIYDVVVQSQTIAGDYDLIWTALARRGEDQDNNSLILGPQSAGKKLASEIPGWFTYTFRYAKLPADPATGRMAPIYRLYIDAHKDEQTPGVSKIMGNSRKPMNLPDGVLPASGYFEPTDLVKAVTTIEQAGKQAATAISTRLKRAYKTGVREGV